MKTLTHHSLLHENTFGIDQQCDHYIVYGSADDAVTVARTGFERPLLILGGGSNLLLTSDFHGTVITPERRFEVEAHDDDTNHDAVLLRCWAGTDFDEVVDYAVTKGWHGLENLSLIPGQCGASAVQNIGAYGAEIKDVMVTVEAVELATGQPVTIQAADCDYSYRHSRFKAEWRNRYLITYVTYRLSRTFMPRIDYGNIRQVLAERQIDEDRVTAPQLRQAIIDIRRAKLPDPAEVGNAGSFFMNPVVDRATFEQLRSRFADLRYFEHGDQYKIPAGWLIDQCGWKGRSLGKAGVHDKQALVLVNRGGAKGADVVALMQAIQHDVEQKYGLRIEPEVNII
jgi:UDP-N-acetylmuramate dehydrogenase